MHAEAYCEDRQASFVSLAQPGKPVRAEWKPRQAGSIVQIAHRVRMRCTLFLSQSWA